MSIVHTLRFIAGHPLNRQRKLASLARFVKWQIGARLVPGRVVFEWVNGSRFFVGLGETGLTGNVYCGLHEFADMAYLMHVTSPEDLFVDVGANVGSYTLLACAARGARGICFEPVPATYRRLLDNIKLNDLGGRVRALNIGLSDAPGELRFTSGENCMNHVLAEGERPENPVMVAVSTLDIALEGEVPAVLKVDVEGFETSVIKGASRTLESPSLHSVIMELNGSGSRYGFSEDRILAAMVGYGFSTYMYEPFARRLLSLDGKNSESGNTLFIRDLPTVERRLALAPRMSVAGVQL
jgi:FkbM family methyltransferase